MTTSTITHCIIGSGAAGCSLALRLAELGEDVCLILKDAVTETNSWYAQGGIAAAVSKNDAVENHVEDTLKAGAGLSHRPVVEEVIAAGPSLIADLVRWGVRFASSGNDYHLTLEGGHTSRRVLHSEDATGREIMRTLWQRVKEHARIKIFEHHVAVDLITTDHVAPQFEAHACVGVYLLNMHSQEIFPLLAQRTYLCTGGHGKTFLYTSNPDAATGDGVAMGWRAGCRIANLEFMQFHPTCLYDVQAKTMLISEAVRGEGAVLVDHQGEDFCRYFDPRGSLAPRDIVARAIDHRMKATATPCVFLDTTRIPQATIEKQFPNIRNALAQRGFTLGKDKIPVVPAAHYSCGGLIVDRKGRTSVANLYALGEVACTGLHGANRLASNSLLEALYFARVACDPVDEKFPAWQVRPWVHRGVSEKNHHLVLSSLIWDELRRTMWHLVGIERSEKLLEKALARLQMIHTEIEEIYWQERVSRHLVETRNLALVALLTVRCALKRKESRGCHFIAEYPTTDAVAYDTILGNT